MKESSRNRTKPQVNCLEEEASAVETEGEESLGVVDGDETLGFAEKTVEKREVPKDAGELEVRNFLQPIWLLQSQLNRNLEEASSGRSIYPGHP